MDFTKPTTLEKLKCLNSIPKSGMASEKISEAALVDSSIALASINVRQQKDEGVTFLFTFDDEF